MKFKTIRDLMLEEMPEKTFVLISPEMDAIKACTGEEIFEALRDFRSSVWRQGWGADERVDEEYKDWLVFELETGNLYCRGTFAELGYGKIGS